MSSRIGRVCMWVVIIGTSAAICFEVLMKAYDTVGSTFVLGITALVVVWYADETRRLAISTGDLAEETRKMAEGTQLLAEASLTAHLMIFYETDILFSRVINNGPGIAFNVIVNISGADHHIATVLPAGGSASTRGPELGHAGRGRIPVTVRYTDSMQKQHEIAWECDPQRPFWHVSG